MGRKKKIDVSEMGTGYPDLLRSDEAAELLRLPRSTFAKWKRKGLFDGAFKKRGKTVLFVKPKLIDCFFNA